MLPVAVARHSHYVETQSVLYSEAPNRVELSGTDPGSLASAIFHEPALCREARAVGEIKS